jgi:hypothetical protein
MVSHKMYTFNDYYITAQHCILLQVLFLAILNKTHKMKKSYSQDHSTQTQHTVQVIVLFKTANWEPSFTI